MIIWQDSGRGAGLGAARGPDPAHTAATALLHFLRRNYNPCRETGPPLAKPLRTCILCHAGCAWQVPCNLQVGCERRLAERSKAEQLEVDKQLRLGRTIKIGHKPNLHTRTI